MSSPFACPDGPATAVLAVAGWLSLDREKQDVFPEASMDGFTAVQEKPPRDGEHGQTGTSGEL